MKVTEAEAEALLRQQALKMRGTQPPPAPKKKYRNQPVLDEDGFKFDSKLEAKHAAEYRKKLRDGEIKGYGRQFEIHIGGGVIMRPDHAILHHDDRLELIDSKGYATREWRVKQRVAAGLGMEVTSRGKND